MSRLYALAGGEAVSNAVTRGTNQNLFCLVARNCSGATRSAELRRLNTIEINGTWMNNRSVS